MDKLSRRAKRSIFIVLIASASIAIFYVLNLPKANIQVVNRPDLIIYTPLSRDLYLPVVKEFQEREGVTVDIREESEKNIIHALKAGSFEGDFILGIHSDTAEKNKALFSYRATLNAIPFVIAFNNNLLATHEQIEGYNCLTKASLKGKIGFVSPHSSTVYKQILNLMADGSDDPDLFKESFAHNTKDYYLNSIADINSSLKNGSISVGITSKQSAILLSQGTHNINFLDKGNYDCIINFGVALPKKTHTPPVAYDFYEFASSKDVKRFISSYLNSDIGGKIYELD